jgi:predicted TIM-barrel fold metal-dependent hydrolase
MIVDFHTHIFPPFFREKKEEALTREKAFRGLYASPRSSLIDREELLRVMDEEGIDRCVTFGFPWEGAEYFKRHNDYIIESVQRYPERLIGFSCFSPLSSEGPAEARRCLEAGLSGVGELALYGPDNASYESVPGIGSLMEICQDFRVPMLLHVNEPVGHSYPGKTRMGLAGLYALIKKYPLNRIVLAHWGGGIFFYGMMKKEVKETLKNTWFDTAASPFLYEPQVYKLAGDIVGFDKILFGTDYPLIRPGRYFREMKGIGLPEDAQRKICGQNAAELLGIPG